MTKQIDNQLFSENLMALWQETFEKVIGIYLDGGASLEETLAGLTAEEASRPITETGTTIAGQVFHVRFYLNVMNEYMDGRLNEKIETHGSAKA
jgi:hypothetical protein